MLERSLVHSDRLFVAPIFTWYTNFISLRDLLALPHVEDPLLMNSSPARALGLLTVLLGLPALAAGLAALYRKQPAGLSAPTAARHPHTFFFALALAGYGFLTLSASQPIWEVLTPLALVQFPWRMLGPAALCAAILVGASLAALSHWLSRRPVDWLSNMWTSTAVLTLTLGVLYFGSLSWWFPRTCDSPGDPTVAGMLAFERDSHTIGTTAKGEYLPLTAAGVPENTSLADAIASGGEPSRLSLPDGAVVTHMTADDPLNAVFQVNALQPVRAVYQQFYFPGSVRGGRWPAGQRPARPRHRPDRF